MAGSKIDICNMTLSTLGNYGTVTDIDNPTNDKEIVFKTWYDNSRQAVLRLTMPNFALSRVKVAQLVATPVFGYAYGYQYPTDCLKLLGIGNIQDKQNNYSVEGNVIYTDEDYDEGMPIRYVTDEKDVTKFTADFAEMLSWYLASNVCLPITQDNQRKAYIDKLLPLKMSTVGSLNSQENKPIRKSNSRFKAAREVDDPTFESKK